MIATAQIERILDRYSEIEARMASDPGAAFAKLAKEYSDLGPIVTKARVVQKMRADLAQSSELAADQSADAELRAMANEELVDLKRRLPEAERELSILMLPKDSADMGSAAAAGRAGRAARYVPVAVGGALAALALVGALRGGPAPLAPGRVALVAACYLAWCQAAPGRGRVAITTGFGLVHGFAFAGALADLDVHGAALAAGLVGFNLGIELTQLALLAVGWGLLTIARRSAPRAAELAIEVAAGLAMVPVTGWLITRAL